MAGEQPKGRPKAPRANRKKPATITIGDQLEYRVMRLFLWQGYVVRRGVEIYTDQFLNRATDLDVLAVRFLPLFRRHLQIAECKSGTSRPLDRIFWLAGLGKFASADNATLVRDSTPWDIVDFAKRNGVEILDKPALDAMESALAIPPNVWPGPTDRSFFQRNLTDWNKALTEDPEAAQVNEFLTGEFRWDNEISSIRYLLFAMRRLTKAEEANPGASAWRWLLSECFVQLLVFSLAFLGKSLGLKGDDLDGLIRKQLKYGPLEVPLVRRIMRFALKLTEQTLDSVGVSSQRLNPRDFDFPEPPNSEEVIRILHDIVDHVDIAYALPSFADYVLYEVYLKLEPTLPVLSRATQGSDSQSLARLAISICRELQSIGAIPAKFGDVFATTFLGPAHIATESAPRSSLGEPDGIANGERSRQNSDDQIVGTAQNDEALPLFEG